MAYIRFTNDGWYSRCSLAEAKEVALRVASACAEIWAHDDRGSRAYVAFDTRAGSAEIARAVASFLGSEGLSVHLAEAPTPMPALNLALAEDAGAAGGFMVGADHRSSNYLGIRVRDSRGHAMGAEEAALVERMVPAKVEPKRGHFNLVDLTGPYLTHLRSSFTIGQSMAPSLSIVVDPLYGTARGIARAYFAGLGLAVREIHGANVDDFGDLHPAAIEPWADDCERAVRVGGADMGFVFDGPSNRLAVIDEHGSLVPSPKVHALAMAHLVEDRGLSGRVVVPRTASVVVERQARRLGLELVRVGDERAWARDEVNTGGVLSTTDVLGGLTVPAFGESRDAFVVALCVLELTCQAARPLSELVAELDATLGTTSYGLRAVPVDVATKAMLKNLLPGVNPGAVLGKAPTLMSHAMGLEMHFEDESWFLVRTSESEPLVRIFAEAPTKQERDRLLDAAEDVVERTTSR